MGKFIGFIMPFLRIFKIFAYYFYDAMRFIRYSNTLGVNSTKKRMMATLIFKCHVVEKGLTMPNRRWNFGHDKILSLVNDSNMFIEKYGIENDELKYAVGVLKTYLEEHASNGIDVPENIKSKISDLTLQLPDIPPVKQKRLTRKEYFHNSDADFIKFSLSRASVRNYSGKKIPVDLIIKAIDISKHAPSACNRQATRVYVVQKREQIDSILFYQNGCSGFGHLANTLLILTSDASSFQGIDERNFGWIDCGIFALNLMYSLYHLKIGSCPLNAGMSISDQKSIRNLCNIPPEEDICLFITCGYLPDKIDLAKSQRKETDGIIKIL